jgi:hypothetical protein
VSLNDATYETLMTLYENALDYNMKDYEIGLDGSNWCLETNKVSSYLKACYWTPTYNPQARRLTGLVALGRELWTIADMESRDGPLY